MWHDLKIPRVGMIEKCVAEYTVWMITVLPYAKMKVKIYENQDRRYTGITDVHIKRKFDGRFEAAVGFGKSIDEALEDTLKYFNEMLDSDYPQEEYPDGLTEEDIEYAEYSDF